MTPIKRDCYGAMVASGGDETIQNLHRQAVALTARAAAGKRLPAAFDRTVWQRINSRFGNKRVGTALHHEIYDVTPDGRKVLVCCREIEGTKYGIKTVQKSYYILTKHGAGVRVIQANKAVAAKAAKSTGELGQAIEVCEGKAKLVLPAAKERIGYKLVERNNDGMLVSVWDDSRWSIGVTRTEAATDDHSGGFYYYGSEAEALTAAERNDVFGTAHDHRNLVLIEVHVSGREYRHGAKRCATRMTPVRIVREIN